MAIQMVQLTRREDVADGTMAFHFEKPEGFQYKAGQFADFTLIEPPETDAEGNIRGFSLASAPYEKDLCIATRLRDTAFKRVLKHLPDGTQLKLDAPYGSFTLHKNAAIPAVFLTGGIGITVVRSIVLDAIHKAIPRRIVLFYANRRPEDAAFLDELRQSAAQNPQFTFVPTMTKMELSREAWAGERGYVTKAMLKRYVADLTAPIYYSTGPASLVAAMRKILNDAEVDDDNIRTEEFTGY
ncbi:MAG TPA: FAD-dependent oxidoreductase [Ktedonobacterales bacterium]|nr:FAD-dependent oxidoreductase [Ktedonobacterales bacterium]